jgi:hypothetical protein
MHRAELVESIVGEAGRRGKRQAADEVARITRRLQEIAIMIAQGLTNVQVTPRAVLLPVRSPITLLADNQSVTIQ